MPAVTLGLSDCCTGKPVAAKNFIILLGIYSKMWESIWEHPWTILVTPKGAFPKLIISKCSTEPTLGISPCSVVFVSMLSVWICLSICTLREVKQWNTDQSCFSQDCEKVNNRPFQPTGYNNMLGFNVKCRLWHRCWALCYSRSSSGAKLQKLRQARSRAYVKVEVYCVLLKREEKESGLVEPQPSFSRKNRRIINSWWNKNILVLHIHILLYFSVGSTGTLWSEDTIVTLLKEKYSIERGSTEKEVEEERSPAGLTKTHLHAHDEKKNERWQLHNMIAIYVLNRSSRRKGVEDRDDQIRCKHKKVKTKRKKNKKKSKMSSADQERKFKCDWLSWLGLMRCDLKRALQKRNVTKIIFIVLVLLYLVR